MAGRRAVYGGGGGGGSGGGLNSDAILLQNQRVPLILSSSSSLGSRSMVSFEDTRGGNNQLFCSPFDQENNMEEEEEDQMDEYFHQPEKKRRLTPNQVQFLEKSFELENKLEPERKIQLAKNLGLQPRQVAIWFQNRRARWKTKHLEKDYEGLQSNYNSLKVNYDNLLKERDKLKDEVSQLTGKLMMKQNDKGESDLPSIIKSDSSYMFEADQSDLSLEDEECKPREQQEQEQAYVLPEKIEETDYSDDTSSNIPCFFPFPDEEPAFGFWSY